MVSTPSTTPSLALALPLALALKRRPGDVINPCLWQTLLAQPSLALALDHSLTRTLYDTGSYSMSRGAQLLFSIDD